MVLFADGVAPGHGTSASDNSSNEDDLNLLKPKKLSSRRNRKKVKDSTYLMYGNIAENIENIPEKKASEIELV